MAIPYEELFLGLLAIYCVYSVYAKVDGRYPVAGALVLLVGAAILDAAGDLSSANAVAVFVFFLLSAGVLLLLVEHVREERATSRAGSVRGGQERHAPSETETSSGEPPDDAEGTPEHRPDHPPALPVDAAGHEFEPG